MTNEQYDKILRLMDELTNLSVSMREVLSDLNAAGAGNVAEAFNMTHRLDNSISEIVLPVEPNDEVEPDGEVES